jgi:hypothetical protein
MLDAIGALSSTADGVMELGVFTNTPVLTTDQNVDFFVSVSDLSPVLGASVTGSFSNNGRQVFSDNGTGADELANDGIYSSTLQTPSVPGSASLRVDVTASGKTPASEARTFEILGPVGNDNFADRIVLAQGSSQTSGDNRNATSEPGEPRYPSSAGGKSVWWQWNASEDGFPTISTTGSNYDTTLAIYTGSNLENLVLIGSNDDSSGLQSAVSFTAFDGVSYFVQVDGYAGDEGDIQLSFPPAGGGQTGAPFIVSQPIGRSVLIGQSFYLSVEASGADPLAYQWNLDGSQLPGETSSRLDVAVSDESHEGPYTVDVSNSVGNATSNTAFISVDLVAIQPSNDYFDDAFELVGSSGDLQDINFNATGETDEPNHAEVSEPIKSVWYSYTPELNGTLGIDTLGSDFDTVLAIYTGSSVSSLTELDSNDDAPGLGLQSSVSASVRNGSSYFIAVAGYAGSEGQIKLNYSLDPAGGAEDNDDFSNRTELSGTSVSSQGNNTGASGEPDEPNHANGSSSPLASIWWTWTAPDSGTVTITTEGSDIDTTLAAYTGSSLAELVVEDENDDFGDLTSRIMFFAKVDETYQIAVDGYAEAEGDISLAINLEDDGVSEASDGSSVGLFLLTLLTLPIFVVCIRKSNQGIPRPGYESRNRRVTS